MSLSESQKKYLRGLGHRLKPLVTVADAGLSESVMKEFESTINHHELIKIRVRVGDRKQRNELIGELCDKSASELVTRIGNIALVYRPNKEKPSIVLPKAG